MPHFQSALPVTKAASLGPWLRSHENNSLKMRRDGWNGLAPARAVWMYSLCQMDGLHSVRPRGSYHDINCSDAYVPDSPDSSFVSAQTCVTIGFAMSCKSKVKLLLLYTSFSRSSAIRNYIPH